MPLCLSILHSKADSVPSIQLELTGQPPAQVQSGLSNAHKVSDYILNEAEDDCCFK